MSHIYQVCIAATHSFSIPQAFLIAVAHQLIFSGEIDLSSLPLFHLSGTGGFFIPFASRGVF
jgi:hypothetical protein